MLKKLKKVEIFAIRLYMTSSRYPIRSDIKSSAVVHYHEGFLLEELGRLEELEDIRITIHSAIGAEAILRSPALQQSIKKLSLNPCSSFEFFKLIHFLL